MAISLRSASGADLPPGRPTRPAPSGLFDLAVIMMVCAVTAREPPFNGTAVEAPCDPVDLEKRRALRNFQHLGIAPIGAHGAQPFFRACDRDPETLLIENVELVRQFPPDREVEAPEETGGCDDPLED